MIAMSTSPPSAKRPTARRPASMELPSTAQFLGELAPNLKSGDDNRRLGFEVHGYLNKPSDVDVYSFRADGGTEVWLDLDRTSSFLDSVVELVDANGTVIARSDNSYAEQVGDAALLGPAVEPGSFDLLVQGSLFDQHPRCRFTRSPAGSRRRDQHVSRARSQQQRQSGRQHCPAA